MFMDTKILHFNDFDNKLNIPKQSINYKPLYLYEKLYDDFLQQLCLDKKWISNKIENMPYVMNNITGLPYNKYRHYFRFDQQYYDNNYYGNQSKTNKMQTQNTHNSDKTKKPFEEFLYADSPFAETTDILSKYDLMNNPKFKSKIYKYYEFLGLYMKIFVRTHNSGNKQIIFDFFLKNT